MRKLARSQWRKFRRRLVRWKNNIRIRVRIRRNPNRRGEILSFLRRLALILTLVILKHLLNPGCGDGLCSTSEPHAFRVDAGHFD